MALVTDLSAYHRARSERQGAQRAPDVRVNLLVKLTDLNRPWQPVALGNIVVSISDDHHLCLEAMRENGEDVLRLCSRVSGDLIWREILDFLMTG